MRYIYILLVLLFAGCSPAEERVSEELFIREFQVDTNVFAHIGENILLDGSAKSVDSSSLRFEWSENGHILSYNSSFHYIFNQKGVRNFKFTAIHDSGESISKEVIIVITETVVNRDIPLISESLITEYLEAINSARSNVQDCGTYGIKEPVPPLVWSNKLYKAAYTHNQDMVNSNFFSHTGSGSQFDWAGFKLGIKSRFVDRINYYNYTWTRVGENLAGGSNFYNSRLAVEGWLNSDAHCSNLMSSSYTEVGLNHLVSETSTYFNYWTQELGKPHL